MQENWLTRVWRELTGMCSDTAFNALRFLQAANDNNSGGMAIIVIDVQREFCDPAEGRGNEETMTVSDRIAAAIPRFRAVGIPVYAVYFDSSLKRKSSEVDWYKFTPQKEDILVPKNRDSAFQGSNIKKLLKKNGHRKLLACGFNRSACVKSTIIDARNEEFDVALMLDLTGDDKENPTNPSSMEAYWRGLAKRGIRAACSEDVLQNISSCNANQPAMTVKLG